MTLEANAPVLLLPLRLETRFINQELWIRAYPDDAFLNDFDNRLTEEEALDRDNYTNASDKSVAWSELVNKYGAYRAAWIIHPDASEQVDSEDDIKEAAFQFLPGHFQAYGTLDVICKLKNIFQKNSNLGIYPILNTI